MASLDLGIDRLSEVPLGTQLIWKLRTLIAAGQLKPGDRLPGIREVAESAGVNVNTVRSVFARLEEQGLLKSEQGRGTFVAADVRAATILAAMTETALAQANEAGIDPRELAAALYVSPAADERAERRAVRAEIARLEREVAALDPLGTLQPEPLGALQPEAVAPAPRLLSAAELRETRDALAERLEQLRHERDEWRIENEQRERDERESERVSSRRSSRWREAGVWTGAPHVRVSWTSP